MRGVFGERLGIWFLQRWASVVGAMEIAHCGIAEGRKTFSSSEEKEEMQVFLCICRQSSFELASSYDSAFQLIQMFFLISGKFVLSFCYFTCHMSNFESLLL